LAADASSPEDEDRSKGDMTGVVADTIEVEALLDFIKLLRAFIPLPYD
jgi:hypothetical protein